MSKVEVKLLTAVAVANYRKRASRRVVRDTGARSLFLIIHPSGVKSWQMRFRTGKRIGKITLGPVDISGREQTEEPQLNQPLTLAAARALAATVHRQRAMGRDPIADAKTQHERRKLSITEGASNTFGVCAKNYIEQHASKKIRRWKELSYLLGLQPTADGLTVIRGGLAQRWSDKAVTEIDGHDIHSVVAETRLRGAPGLERRSKHPTETRAYAMHSCLSGMFRWLLQHRRVERNPCVDVHRPDMPKARERKLSEQEIVAFWQATVAIGQPFAPVLQLLLLTGCRLNEIAAMRWEELQDEKAGTARFLQLPGSRTKNHRAHAVALAPLAQQILAGVPRIVGCPYVFSTNGRTPLSGWSKTKARLDAHMGIPPWRLHDLRRTCASGMQKLGVRAEVIERCLNHISGSFRGVAGIYQRDPMTDETRDALLRWAQHVKGLTSGKPANVVALKRKNK